ncbi:MAG TPA: type II toxin-antitoxin system Phd/YefM family antitoxin [Terriglobales bacterium]|nr:type II toxin-antitoxin system Phd/YefM family antitoxin [Terriglobales bacterium]
MTPLKSTQNPSLNALEEQLEFSNVTNVREKLLPLMDRLQENPPLRMIILKHGAPQAVLMSYQTYDTLKKLVDTLVKNNDALTQQQRVDAAYARLRAERGSSVRPAAEIGVNLDAQVEAAKVILNELQNMLAESQTKIQKLDRVLVQERTVAG